MTIQEYTRRIDHLKWVIASKKEKILVLESVATNTSPSLTGMPHNPSPTTSRMADAVCQKIDLEASIKTDERAIQELRQQMQEAIDRVNSPKHQTVLSKRYIRELGLDSIAEEIMYSRRTTERILHEAEKALEKILAGDGG